MTVTSRPDRVSELIHSSQLGAEDGPKSQASLAERRFLEAWMREEYTGAGEVVELGVGGGGTAYALCAGLEASTRVQTKEHRVHLFDWYTFGPGKYASRVFFRPGKRVARGDSFEDDVRTNLAQFDAAFRIYNGDIATVEFDIAKIELLHIDIAKTLETFKAVVRRFFDRLEVGTSVILHQDFASPSLSWIHYSTGVLLPYIRILSDPIRSTLPFSLERTVPVDLLRRISDDEFSVEEKIQFIQLVKEQVTRDRSGTLPFDAVLDMSCGFVAHGAGLYDEAERWADKVADVPYIREKRQDHLDKLRARP